MLTKEEIALAKATVGIIEKIAERTERKCPDCEGSGGLGNRLVTESLGDLAYKGNKCRKCKGIGKVAGKWKWKPNWGEMVIYNNNIALITGVDSLQLDNQYDILLQLSPLGTTPEVRAKLDDVIPILHWEDYLEPMGNEH